MEKYIERAIAAQNAIHTMPTTIHYYYHDAAADNDDDAAR